MQTMPRSLFAASSAGLVAHQGTEASAEVQKILDHPGVVLSEPIGALARTSDENAFNRSLAPLENHLAALGVPRPKYKPHSPTRFEDQARVLLDAKVPVFSFVFGIPP